MTSADFVALRLGYQMSSEVFEQQGNHLPGDAVSYAIYSAGIGIRLLKNTHLNVGYEYLNIDYADYWYLNTNVNKEIRNTIFSDIAYSF